MKSLLPLFILSSLLVGCHADKPEIITAAECKTGGSDLKSLCYQTFGLPDPYMNKALHQIFSRYGVSFKAVAGCVVTDSLIKSVEQNNSKLFSILDKLYGTGTKGRIMEEAGRLAAMQQRIEEIMRQQTIVQKQEALLSKRNAILVFDPNTNTGGGKLIITARIMSYADGDLENKVWRRFAVDTFNNKATPEP